MKKTSKGGIYNEENCNDLRFVDNGFSALFLSGKLVRRDCRGAMVCYCNTDRFDFGSGILGIDVRDLRLPRLQDRVQA